MDQEVKYIAIKDLVLWTENPRDPIDANATDQDIVNKAFEDKLSKWSLPKLAAEMGTRYDFSELPTVVYHNNKPVVYDGNRRIILGKIKHGLVTIKSNGKGSIIPDFPLKIPCNVCKEDIALENVYRKHSDTGSWLPLERDYFLHKFMGKEKSLFLILEENTGIISANPHLNQRFVKEEIFKEDILNSLGFGIVNDKLNSVHNNQEAYSILANISSKIKQKEITTRKSRGKVYEILDPSIQQMIAKNKGKILKPSQISFSNQKPLLNKKLTPRIISKEVELFGSKLYLRSGVTSNLYRDISDLYQFYKERQDKLSPAFISLIRMALRLLCETAAKETNNMKLDSYLRKYFAMAKDTLDKDSKTTLANHNVTEDSIVQLLHTGAHIYKSAGDIGQTIALSLIIGAILTISHGK